MLKLYNRLTGKLEKFEARSNTVNIFVCGPTLYDDVHLGHLRILFLTDVLVRYLSYMNFKPNLVINLTDMDIKIIERAQKEGSEVKSLIERYYERVISDIQEIIDTQIQFVRPSKLINESANIIEDLISKKIAYRTKSGIYCDISYSDHLGKLSKKEKSIILKTILEPEENKRNPADFKLWTNSGYEYSSIFGKGMVGWHLQDYTVIYKIFGGRCDIHIGAKELIFPHHEFILLLGEYHSNIYPISRYFVYTGLLKYKGDKMSKSLGNIIYFRDIKNKYDLNTLRLYYLFLKNNKDYNFNINKLKYYNKLLEKLKPKIAKSRKGKDLEKKIIEYKKDFIRNIENNLNIYKSLITWLKLNKYIENKFLNEKSLETLRETYSLFSRLTGIFNEFAKK